MDIVEQILQEEDDDEQSSGDSEIEGDDYLFYAMSRIYDFNVLMKKVRQNPSLNNAVVSNAILKYGLEAQHCLCMSYIDCGVGFEIYEDCLHVPHNDWYTSNVANNDWWFTSRQE